MTSLSPLERRAGPGNVLAKEPPDAKEFAGLVRSGLARLKDAESDANSLDSRFDLAYSAAHALCLAALRHTAWRAFRDAAGLPGFRFHDLRHTVVTDLLEAGEPEHVIEAVTGHLSRRMLEHYSHQ